MSPRSRDRTLPTGPTAAELLARARASRAVWPKEFPGFKARAVVTIDSQTTSGTLAIDAEGSVDLGIPAGKAADWAEDQFESMVQHRRPDGEIAERGVVFADDNKRIPWAARSS